MSRTSQASLVNALLEASHQTTLEAFLTEKRAEGLSYERIARDLHDLTDGTVSVTWVTIRNWTNDLESVA